MKITETIKKGIKKIKLAKMHIMIKHYDKQEAKYIKKFEKHSKKFNDSVDKLHESLDKIVPDDAKKSKIPQVDPKYAGPVPVKDDKITPFRFTVNGTNTSEGVIVDPYANWSPAGKMLVENMRKIYEKNFGNKEE
jgi:hypothetical protein